MVERHQIVACEHGAGDAVGILAKSADADICLAGDDAGNDLVSA